MKFSLTKTIGDSIYTFEEECKNDLEFFKKASLYSSIPSVCEGCHSKDIHPKYAHAKGYDFVSIQCGSCFRELQYGQRKDGSGLFPKHWIVPPSAITKTEPEAPF